MTRIYYLNCVKFLNTALIKFIAYFIIGVIVGLNTSFISQTNALIIVFSLCLIVGILILKNRFSLKYSFLFGLLIALTSITFGIATVKLHQQNAYQNHYSNYVSLVGNPQAVIVKVTKVLKANTYNDRYEAKLLQIDQNTCQGNILLNINTSATAKPLKVDDVLWLKSNFKTILPPLNPFQFNYKTYLKNKHIEHQLYLNENNIALINNHKKSIIGYADKLRNYIIKKLNPLAFGKNERAIIYALLLGQKTELSKETYNDYAQAGVIHILAVSGLHVGLLLLLLKLVLQPLLALKNGAILQSAIIILLLWGFALIAGLSASVVRAVTMFSLLTVANNLKRPTNSYNTLFLSMFLLLLCKPSFIYDIGFQLSYSAVFSIVYFHSKFSRLWQPKNKLVNYYWQLSIVTIAAQIGVLPLSLFYFHQFPGLFFLTNLVVLPFLGLIIGLGIVVILLAVCNINFSLLVNFYQTIIETLNQFIAWVAQQDLFIITAISFNRYNLIISYLLIFGLVVLIPYKNFKSLVFGLTLLLLASGLNLANKHQLNHNNFIIFHTPKQSVIGLKQNTSLTLFSNLEDTLLNFNSAIKNYKIGNAITHVKKQSQKSIYTYLDQTLLVVDSLNIYNIDGVSPDIVLLQHSPKLNLNRLIDNLNPKLIIADGSNYKSLISTWDKTCRIKKRPFYDTSKKGAYSIK